MSAKESIERGVVAVRTLAMPADTNPAGDVFGGWLMSQMDIAGAIIARQRARGRVVTVAVDRMEFHKPVFVGDLVSCHVAITETGASSITVHVETFVRRDGVEDSIKVTEGTFVYVAINADRQPQPIPDESAQPVLGRT